MCHVGISKGDKGYRLWCYEPIMNKARNVVFNEHEMPFLVSMKSGIQQEPQSSRASITEVEVEFPTEADNVPDQEHGSDEGDHSEEEETPATGGDLSNYQLARDRVRRVTRPPFRFGQAYMIFYALNVAEEIEYFEPATYSEAMRSKESREWMKAMEEEINSLHKNGTWLLVDKPKSQKAVSCKWIYKKKIEVTEKNRIKFKARLVARGFTQREGIDFNEIF